MALGPRRWYSRENVLQDRVIRWAAASVLVGVFCGAARAEDPEALLQKGVELRRNKDDEGALKVFEQAYEVQKSPKAAAQIGLAAQAIGIWGRADRRLREALASPNDPWIRKHHSTIEDALKVIGSHVGHLEVSGSPSGAQVRVDGELVGTLPLGEPVSVTAGRVALEVSADGYLSILRAGVVTVGQLTRERFQLQSLAQQSAVTPPPADRNPTKVTVVAGRTPDDSGAGMPSHDETTKDATTPAVDEGGGISRRTMALGFGGLAAGTLVLGIVEHLRWQSKTHSFNDNSACDNLLSQKGAAGCQTLYEAGQSARNIAFVGYGLTAGLAATAVVLLLTDPGRHDETQKVACAPLTAATTAGLGCSFRF